MDDMTGILVPGKTNIEVFQSIGDDGAAVNNVQAWHKPRHATMLYFSLIGAGGGGGGGTTRGVGVTGGGGGGGGPGATGGLLIPAMFLPEVLYFIIPNGGLGGAANSDGSSSFHNTSIYLRIFSGSGVTAGDSLVVCNPGGNGSKGTTGAGGGGGAAGNANASSVYAGLGIKFELAGTSGVAGGNSAAPSDQSVASAVTGGGGGAGILLTTPAKGGNVVAVGTFFESMTVDGGVSGGGNGQDGLNTMIPFRVTGGSGGGSINSGVGGAGGNGGYGCGGGGGGAGTTGGAGGNGGPGLIVVSWW